MNIAIIAHDKKKHLMIELCKEYKEVLEKHYLIATGTTGLMVMGATNLKINQMKSGPLGGDQQIGAMVADGKIDITTHNSRYLKFNANSGQERFACYSSAQKDAFLYKKVTTTPETKSDFSLDCSITVEPTWTISKDAIDFADKYVGVSYTETFTINASNLAEDIAPSNSLPRRIFIPYTLAVTSLSFCTKPPFRLKVSDKA